MFGKNLKEVPSVLVKLLNLTGIPVQQTYSRSRGEFEFSNLRLGQYVVEATAEGYKVAREKVDLFFGSRRGVMILLEPEDKIGAEQPNPGRMVSVRELGIPGKARKAFIKGLRELNEKNRPERSIPHFLKAIDLYPDYDEAYVQLSMAHLYQNQPAAALEFLERAIVVNQENARAYSLLGLVYREQKQVEESEQVLQKAVKLDAENWLSHLELAKTLVQQRKFDDALGHARQAHELNDQSEIAHLIFYDLLIFHRDFQTALEEVEQFLTLHPDHPSVPKMRQARDKLRASLGNDLQ